MDKKQIKLFGDSLIQQATILMQEANETDTVLDISIRIVDSIKDEFLTEEDANEIEKYLKANVDKL